MSENLLNPDINRPKSVELRLHTPTAESPETFNSKVEMFYIYNENREKIGYVGIGENPTNPNELTISQIDILRTSDYKYKNQGYGVLVYQKLAELVTCRGKRFVSSSLANQYALKVWDELVKKGIAEKDTSKQKWDSGIYFVNPK